LYSEVPADRVHRLFYPVIPTIITSRYFDEVAGMLASSCMPASLNPPMVALAIMKTHRTYKIVKQSDMFAVSWMSYQNLEKIKKLAEKSPEEVRDKLLHAGIKYHGGRKLRDLPIPDEAEAWIECKTIQTVETGDHELFIASVEAAYAVDDFKEYWEYRRYRPVLYVGITREDVNKYAAFKL